MTKLFYKDKPVKIYIAYDDDWLEVICPICGCDGVAVNKDNIIKPHSNWGEPCPGAKLTREKNDL